MLRRKIPGFIWLAALFLAGICGSLAWMALTERQLTIAGKSGVHYHEGRAAVFAGFLWLAGALGFVGTLAIYSRFKTLIWLALALSWASMVTWYLVFVGAGNAL